jgi:hypothetical protein
VQSRIFYTDAYRQIEERTKALLNSQPDFLSPSTVNSPRAAGDAIQDVLSRSFDAVLGDLRAEYSADFARRAMADLAFTDADGLYYVVDIKTHRVGTSFNMPNLTSVERLTRFYEADNNYFCTLMVKYEVQAARLLVTSVTFVPVEFLSWECLTVGALGWGQIQIASSNNIIIIPGNSRKSWMLTLCDVMLAFYPREIAKIQERMARFEQIKAYWAAKPD